MSFTKLSALGRGKTAAAEDSGGGALHSVPRHVAIIMDGNGRWAKKRLLPRVAGHKAGVDAVRSVTRAAQKIGIEVLTLYAFSSENWRRPEEEIRDLMNLFRHFINSDAEEFLSQKVGLRIIGDYKALAPDIVEMIEDLLEQTKNNGPTTLVVALNYGAQDELVRAARKLAEGGGAGAITADAMNGALDTADLPPLDLLIRTSGEQRLSNFLLWQAAYAELYFTDVLWPDFGEEQLREACQSYANRERRFGGR